MKKIIPLFLISMAGCASIGQFRYSGSATAPFIEEHIVVNAPTKHMIDYPDNAVNKTLTISNPEDKEIVAIVHCSYVQFSGNVKVVVPAHTSQNILIITTARYAYNNLCSLEAVVHH